MSLELRPYQADLIGQARATMAAGARRVLIQSPTGSGKTALTAAMLAAIAARGKRAWFCVHRKELIDQSAATFIEAADILTGIVAAGYPADRFAPVQVCSVGSLARRAALLPPPDFIVWDEAHHVASKSWSEIAAQFPNAKQIGLTATPQRLDGQGLGDHFDALICGPSTAWLIEHDYLSPYRLFAPSASLSMAGVHRLGGDYNRKEVAAKLEDSTVVGDALSHYLAHGAGGRALIFAWSLEASRRIAADFCAAGIEAAHIDGDTPKAERAALMRRFRAGDLRVISNVELFGEGLDVPALDCVFLLRPTDSLGLYLQQVGRGLRRYPGKAAVTIFDHVNNWQRHGLPDDERAWSLEGKKKGAKDVGPLSKRCLKCFGVCALRHLLCPYCGEPFKVEPRQVVEVAGELKEANVDLLRQLGFKDAPERRSLDAWQAEAKARGYKSVWAWRQFCFQQQRMRA